MASIAQFTVDLVKGFADQWMQNKFGVLIAVPVIFVIGGALRELARSHDARDRERAENDWFAQMRRKEEAEYLARTQAENRRDD